MKREISSSLFTEILSHEILLMFICWIYPMIATTVYIVPILYVYYETRRTTTHTFWWKFYHALCIALFACCIYHCRIFIPPWCSHGTSSTKGEKNCMMVKKYPPRDGSSPSAHNVHPLMRSSVQIHIYAVVVDHTYSMFRFSLLTVW